MPLDEVIKTIIYSNYWVDNQMKVVPETLHYEVRIGEDEGFNYSLQCPTKEDKDSPYIINNN